jgi:hypothetical protein
MIFKPRALNWYKENSLNTFYFIFSKRGEGEGESEREIIDYLESAPEHTNNRSENNLEIYSNFSPRTN